MTNIWYGWMQFGLNSSTQQLLLVVDLLLSATALFMLLRFCNTPRLLRYAGLTLAGVGLLALTANFSLPSLHIISQGLLVGLLVGWPFVARDKLTSPNQIMSTESVSAHPVLLGVLSLVGAVFLTGLSNGPTFKTAELPQGVPVNATNLAEGISANFGSQKRIQAIVRAPRTAWATLKADDFSASVDVKNLAEGTHEVAVAVTSKRSDIEVVRVKPTKVTVALEPVIRKTVPVVARFSGKAVDDLVPDDPIFTPDKVEVTGPKSIVTDITQAVTQVQLDNQKQKIEQKYQLVALSSSGSVIEDVSFSPAEVGASIALVKAGKLKTVGIRVKTTGQPASGFWPSEVTVTPSTVLVTASADILDKLTSVDTDAVTLTGLSKDADLQISLSLPAGVAAAEAIGKVTVRVKLSETATTKAITPTIVYDGVDPSLKVTAISPTSVNTIVSGSAATLATLGGSDIQLKLNLSPYKSAGTYAVTIQNNFFTLKEGVSLVSFLPSTINVTLELK